MQTAIWYKDDFVWPEKINITPMLETTTSKEIRITMPKGEVMKEHTAPGDIVVQLLEGKIWFDVNDERHEFKKGDMLFLDAMVPHSLGGIENSIIRLTLAKKDSVIRVHSVLKMP